MRQVGRTASVNIAAEGTNLALSTKNARRLGTTYCAMEPCNTTVRPLIIPKFGSLDFTQIEHILNLFYLNFQM
jgi:hypothetical protein